MTMPSMALRPILHECARLRCVSLRQRRIHLLVGGRRATAGVRSVASRRHLSFEDRPPDAFLMLLMQIIIALVQLYRQLTFRLDPTHHPGAPQGLDRPLASGITLHPPVGTWVAAQLRP